MRTFVTTILLLNTLLLSAVEGGYAVGDKASDF